MDIIKTVLPHSGICNFGDVSSRLLPCRAKSRLPQGAQSVIVSVFPYYLGKNAYDGLNISKYAAVPDYHAVVLDLLNSACDTLLSAYPDESFVPFCDNSPIPEVYAAFRAGLGVIGKNGLLITKDFGSYVFIGEIVTTLALKASAPMQGDCGGCGKCSAACPSGALKGEFHKEKCLSEITQKKGALSPEEEHLVSSCGSAWGCDICQDNCPMNSRAGVTDIEGFVSGAKTHIRLSEPLEGRAYAWRGAEVIERNLRLTRDEQRKE